MIIKHVNKTKMLIEENLMDICKYCKKYGIHKNITRLSLLLKHIGFFGYSLWCVFFNNFLVNLTTILLIILNYNLKYLSLPTWCNFILHDSVSSLIYGTLFSVLASVNLIDAAKRYRAEILWDGDISIFNWDKYNGNHKIDTYYALCRGLSLLFENIVNYLPEKRIYSCGIITDYNFFKEKAEHYNLWRYNDKIFDLANLINEHEAYFEFKRYIDAFKNIDRLIERIQRVQNHINEFCPKDYIKNSLGQLTHELLITSDMVNELKIFVAESLPEHDSNTWKRRLTDLQRLKTISYNHVRNNIRNLVIDLDAVYSDINKDVDFNKIYK